MPTPPSFVVRPLLQRDIPAAHAIYARSVLTETASWEYTPPTVTDFEIRAQNIVRCGFPYLVAESEDRILGFTYANAYNTRAGYRHTVEDTIYIDPAAQRQGVGSRLLRAIIDECTDKGFHQMIAIIGDTANTGSLRLHASHGFVKVGHLPGIGYKFDRWLDGIILQRGLR